MAEPKLKHSAQIYSLHDWYESHRQAQDRSTSMLWHAHKALTHQLNEQKLMNKGYCPTCTQYVPEWEGPVLE